MSSRGEWTCLFMFVYTVAVWKSCIVSTQQTFVHLPFDFRWQSTFFFFFSLFLFFYIDAIALCCLAPKGANSLAHSLLEETQPVNAVSKCKVQKAGKEKNHEAVQKISLPWLDHIHDSLDVAAVHNAIEHEPISLIFEHRYAGKIVAVCLLDVRDDWVERTSWRRHFFNGCVCVYLFDRNLFTLWRLRGTEENEIIKSIERSIVQ